MELLNWTHTEAVLKEYALTAEELFKDRLLQDGRVATGELMDSIHCEVKAWGATIAVDMDLASYWKYIEFDTKPHFPPHLPIFLWVQAKRLLPNPDKTGKVRTRGKNKGIPYTREDMQHSKAYAVQHTIAKYGTKGKPTLANTIRDLNAQYEARIADAVALDFADATDIIIRTMFR